MIDVHSIHQFTVEGLTGSAINFADFAGKKIIVVNVASECGYTPQYQQLQELYTTYSDRLVIIGAPSNDFGGQEPGSASDIAAFCDRNFGVTFPLTTKLAIKENAHPLYRWLQEESLNGQLDSEVRWNFHKYLLNEEGRLEVMYPSSVSPLDDRILDWLQ